MEAIHGHDRCALTVPGARPARRLAGTRARAPLGTFQPLATRFLAWRAQRETLRLLNKVDSATLRDLGISDIESAVYGDPADRMRGYDRNWWRKR